MRFLEVRLEAPEASGDQLTHFYGDLLGLPAADGAWRAFRAGPTIVDFSPARDESFYHFALRVPRNRFAAARNWLATYAELLPDRDSGETTFEFSDWNAVACYAHDPCGNIVELIAHRELPEETPDGPPLFAAHELLGVCEIGVVGPDVRTMALALEPLGIQLWDGTIDEPGRLAFMGGRDGVLILSPTGRGWMPTGRPAEPYRVETVVAGDRDAEVELPGTPHRVSTTTTATR